MPKLQTWSCTMEVSSFALTKAGSESRSQTLKGRTEAASNPIISLRMWCSPVELVPYVLLVRHRRFQKVSRKAPADIAHTFDICLEFGSFLEQHDVGEWSLTQSLAACWNVQFLFSTSSKCPLVRMPTWPCNSYAVPEERIVHSHQKKVLRRTSTL